MIDVLEEHLDELATLAIQRRKLLFAPDVTAQRFRRHEDRIEAHRDGLRVGGAESVRLAVERLSDENPWFVAAAVRVWVEQSDEPMPVILERLGSVPPKLHAAWREGLRSCARARIEALVAANTTRPRPESLALITDAAGWHHLLHGSEARSLVAHERSDVRRSVARHSDDESSLQELVRDRDLDVRRAALWSLARTRSEAGLEIARTWCDAAEPDAFALRVVGIVGVQADGDRIARHLDHEHAGAAALHALGDLGSLRFADSILARMSSPNEAIAASAREACERIVGALEEEDADKSTQIARARLARFAAAKEAEARWMCGEPQPWSKAAQVEPMASLWRRAVTAPTDGDDARRPRRREVSDGFFSGVPSAAAIPGE